MNYSNVFKLYILTTDSFKSGRVSEEERTWE